jgi:uncharacterized RDD family membrane protein YckC
MSDLKRPRLMYLKGWLLLAILVISSAVILNETRDWRIALLLAVVIWSAARFYYFMFYVIEKYVDPGYRFAGILSFLRYLLRRKKPT